MNDRKITIICTGCLNQDEDDDDWQVHECEQRQLERDAGWEARI